MKLIIHVEPNASGRTFIITDGQGCPIYRAQTLAVNRQTVLQILDLNGCVAAAITHKKGLFAEDASLVTKSGDPVKIARKGKSELRALAVSGCDWVVKGSGFPSDYFIDGGYGRIAKVSRITDGIEAEVSLTAIIQDVLCFVLSIGLLFGPDRK